ncbi:AAA family ATPase [Nitrincola alkalisediminis]|uniref:AAA family ATPase n=1 Tax=Nitrincola alkalisediminis TaxID=1366656 RepID=UPI0018735785|nr:AAA family ATPase [Nitrincola alkalisediminis]
MRIVGFRLENIAGLSQLNVTMPAYLEDSGRVTLLSGSSGTGKSAAMRALAYGLTWFSSRLKNDKLNGKMFPISDLKEGADHCSLEIRAEDPSVEGTLSWALTRKKKGAGFADRAEISEMVVVTQHYAQRLQRDAEDGIPLVAYYPSDRSFSIPNFLPKGSLTHPLNVLDNTVPDSVDFITFFHWLREQEDLENELRSRAMHLSLANARRQHAHPDISNLYKALDVERCQSAHPPMTALRQVWQYLLPELTNIRIERHPAPRLLFDKRGVTLELNQLSRSERQLLALSGDIVKRLCQTHPLSLTPLSGSGIILIDDIDQSLDVKMQPTLLKSLAYLFPNCQFIVTGQALALAQSDLPLVHYCLDKKEHAEVQEGSSTRLLAAPLGKVSQSLSGEES